MSKRPPSGDRFFCLEVIVQITVNGEDRSVSSATVSELLGTLTIDPRRVAVELNRNILPKGEYGSTLLQDGDRIEIVHFVGGG